ncbi:MAG TPA: SET domain-containing protein [Candidatus Paceibacterota bacterium]|jgi:SET domain-containing protein|nr:SET domain-containing protein [Candidatus Paceibacterota bacterium]
MKRRPLSKKYLKVRRGAHGLGLFALQPIPKGTFIIEYKGTLLTEAQANERGGQYLFEINGRWTIDGSSRTNLARYINHSCRPNCETTTNERKKRVTIYAKRAIREGEELSYDYGKEFWNDYIKPKGCRCEKCNVKKT